MDAETSWQLDADTSRRLDVLLKDMERDRDRLEGAKDLSMRFVWYPKTHPHQGELWPSSTMAGYYAAIGIDLNSTNDAWLLAGEYFEFLHLPVYTGGDPSESLDGEYAACNVYLKSNGFADLVVRNEACREFEKHAREARALIARVGGDDILSNGFVSGLYYWFLGRDQLTWENNEQPGHPETRTRVAELKDVYAQTMLAIPGILEASGNGEMRRPQGTRQNLKGEAKAKIISGLTKHHDYATGSCLNLEPINLGQFALSTGVGKTTVSDFLKEQFDGFDQYRNACRSGLIGDALKLLNGEFSARILLGNRDPQAKNDAVDE